MSEGKWAGAWRKSDPAQGGQGGQVLAEGPRAGVGDLVGPLGAVALGRAVAEADGVVGAVVERGCQAGQAPEGRGQGCAGDALGVIGPAADRDQDRPGTVGGVVAEGEDG